MRIIEGRSDSPVTLAISSTDEDEFTLGRRPHSASVGVGSLRRDRLLFAVSDGARKPTVGEDEQEQELVRDSARVREHVVQVSVQPFDTDPELRSDRLVGQSLGDQLDGLVLPPCRTSSDARASRTRAPPASRRDRTGSSTVVPWPAARTAPISSSPAIVFRR